MKPRTVIADADKRLSQQTATDCGIVMGRIVIADADNFLLAAYRAFLIAERFEVETVTNGLDCLNALRRSPPDALILDPELPWGSGAGILALMRENTDVPDVPVLILTSRPTLVAESALPFEDYAVMLKPVSPATLAGVVRTLAESGLCCPHR